jgi:drug/metabolite transporter (DMT)-like permease
VVPVSLAALGGAVWVGLFEMGITFLVWLQALRHASSAARVALLIYLSPFLSLVFIHFFVGEPIRNATLAGLVLIVAALLFQQLARPQPDRAA